MAFYCGLLKYIYLEHSKYSLVNSSLQSNPTMETERSFSLNHRTVLGTGRRCLPLWDLTCFACLPSLSHCGLLRMLRRSSSQPPGLHFGSPSLCVNSVSQDLSKADSCLHSGCCLNHLLGETFLSHLIP